MIFDEPTRITFPRTFEICVNLKSYLLKITSDAVCPRVQMVFGFRSLICCVRYSAQAPISSLSGFRLFATTHFDLLQVVEAVVGRHFTTFVMYISSRFRFIELSSSSNIFPAPPTKGLPTRSSFLPGASPMNMTLGLAGPSPGTAWFLVLARRHS